MKIAVIGGGPGGLYFSILTQKALPGCSIDVFERNKPDDSFGFGVVFSDETLSEFLTRDPDSYELIRSKFAYWDELDVARNMERVRITGNGFCGCSRKTLLQLLHQRCSVVGVNLHFEHPIADVQELEGYDLIVAADGIGSVVREKMADSFGAKVQMQSNRFVWLGSTKPLDAFTYFFRTTEWGTFVAHTYQYEEGMSTWVIECCSSTWEKAGFDVNNESDTVAKLTTIFKAELDGHDFITNKSMWRQFPHVTNEKWAVNNVVLLGDAKATAHFSIGSGTKMAMECAIGLSDAVVAHSTDLPSAFDAYERSRRKPVQSIQNAANVSLAWFENMDRHILQPFHRFAFGVMTRSRKVSYENLKLRDHTFTDKVVQEFKELAQNHHSGSPAFSSITIGKTQLENRIAMAPVSQYKASNGLINKWHEVHYGSRATQGVGLILTETVAISPYGRVTEGCAGMYNDEHMEAWKQLNSFIHEHSNAKTGIQLGHAGRKGARHIPWEQQGATLENPWPLIAATDIPFSEYSPVPKAMTESDMDQIQNEFTTAAQRSVKAGFDWIDIQCHHGFLLASFLSPLTNQRKDDWGRSLANRMRFPLQVIQAVRKEVPNLTLSVSISATDWAEGGIGEQEVLEFSKALKELGVDLIVVSTGGTVPHQKPEKGRMWQTPFADAIRNGVGIPVMTGGEITDIDQINTVLLNGNADIVSLGRPLLLDASFVRKAQAWEGEPTPNIPSAYARGKDQLYKKEQFVKRQMDGMRRALKPQSHKK